MRKFFALLAVVLLVASTATAFAKVVDNERFDATQVLLNGQLDNDAPMRQFTPTMRDTISFGFYEVRGDGLKYAIQGETWTFDHGAADQLEGWTTRDLTENLRDYWRQMTQAKWTAAGNPLPWPAMNGAGMVLCGADKGHADSLGWAAGIGYGNNWCQRLTSPTLVYDGTGSVDLTFKYFNDTEADYDYSKVFVKSGSVSTLLNPPGFNGKIGIDSLGAITQQTYTRAIQNAEFGGGTAQRNFTIVLEFYSDGGLSDEDGSSNWDAFYGAWGVDDIGVANNLVPNTPLAYNFDATLGGWISSRCPGVGAYLGIAPVTNYNILDPCACRLAGNILEMHDDSDSDHPEGQHEMAYTPIVDRKTDIGNPTYLDYNRIIGQWDMYAELPQENGVFYRAGWSYYPYENPNIPSLIQWSPRIGINTFFYAGADPTCYTTNNIGTDWGLPPVCEKVKFIFELYASCEAFGVNPCSGVTNFTPIIDNIQVRNVGVPNAPAILFSTGMQLQDGFGQSAMGILSTTDPGNADATYNLRQSPNPAKLGDSLAISGPVPGTSTKWEAKMWFRVKREGPGQTGNATYMQWRNAIAGSPGKPATFWGGANPNFTWGYMDSVEVGIQVSKNKFNSQFRDGPSSGGQNLPPDPDFNWGGGGEQAEGNEILPDLAFTPGTQVDYFISANYICLPTTYYLLPDTAGQFYSEIEILPSYRLDGGTPKFPCLLYVDAYNRGSQFYIENALNVALNGAVSGQPIPNPTKWDRFDYFDASSNWNAAMYRDNGGNNGATIPQLLGYKAILFSTGAFGTGATEARDWQGFDQWLNAIICDGNNAQQGFIANGTLISEIVNQLYPSFMSQTLGAVWNCSSYFEVGCPTGEAEANNDLNYCVNVNPVPGGAFGTGGVPMDVFGNWCPPKIQYAVMGTIGSGAGNKQFVKVGDGYITQFAQVTNDKSAAPSKYRSVIDAFSYHYLTARDLTVAPDPLLECPNDSASIVTASAQEVANAIKWVLNIANPQNIGLCIEPPNCGLGVEEPTGGALVNRLYQNHPNPFNPRTMIKFSLSTAGPASLVIYDVHGRKVKTLVDGHQTSGLHEVVWDGTNDAGQTVSSGIFWSQLSTAGYASNKKMVVLK